MSISLSEIIVILLVALLVIRPEQIPDVAFSLGKLTKFVHSIIIQLKKDVTYFVDSVADSNEAKREK